MCYQLINNQHFCFLSHLGSKTDARGRKAGAHISQEVFDLCELIFFAGEDFPGCIKAILFGDLFTMYTKISNKVVGMLIRRHGLVKFSGEMLYQGQDDDKIIRLVKLPQTLLDELETCENN